MLALLATSQSSAWGQTYYTLTVTVVGQGAVTSTDTYSQNPPINPTQTQIACISGGGTCQASYPNGDLVTLYATPPVGGVFSGWSACNGQLSCTVVMNQPLGVTATFLPCSSSACASASDSHLYGFGKSASSTLLSDGVSSQDSVGADTSLSGLLQWGPSIMNTGNSTLTNPKIAISTGLPASSFQGGAIPAGTSASSLPPNGLLSSPFVLSNPVPFTPGFDSSRTVSPLQIQPGLQTQTVTVTVTPKDSRYFNYSTQIGLQFGNLVAPPGPPGNSTPNVQFVSLQSITWTASPSSTGVETFVNGGPNVWFLNNPVQNSTYTFILGIQVNNPNSFPVNGKTSIDVNMAVFYPTTNGSCGNSVTIPDPLLDGSTPSSGGIAYSTGSSQCWSEITQDTYNIAYWPLISGSNTTSLVSSPNPSNAGQSVTFTATVAPSNGATGTPTGTVTFYDGTSLLGTNTLIGGVTTWIASTLAQGPHSITAVYSGDANFSSSTSPPLPQSVLGATTTSLTSSPNPSSQGQAVTFTATLAWSGPGTPTGSIGFMGPTGSLGSAPLSQGSATFTTSSLALGANSITATYFGDQNFAGSASQPITQTVNQGQASISLSASPNPSTYGQAVTFTATVSANGAPSAPTGTVTFSSGGAALGPAAGLNNGQATFTMSTLAAGDYTITAQYSGDSNFTSGTSTWTQHVIAGSPGPSNSIQAAVFDYLYLYTAPLFTGDPESVAGTTMLTGLRSWVFNMFNWYAATSFNSPTMTIHSAINSQSGNIGAGLYTQQNGLCDYCVTAPYSTALSFPDAFTVSSLAWLSGYKGGWFPNDVPGTDYPGYDSSRSMDTLTIPPGGGYQNVTVTVTPRDPRYNISVVRNATINVGIHGDCRNIAGPPNPTQATCNGASMGPAAGGSWQVGGVQLNTPYAFSAQLWVPNPTSAPISSKPSVTVNMGSELPHTQSQSGSAAVADPNLLGNITFSVSSPTPQMETWIDNIFQVAYPALDPTLTTVSSSASPAFAGQPVTFTAKVANLATSYISPQGTVAFYDGATLLAGPSQNWSFTTSSLAPGPHTITAVFTGGWDSRIPTGCAGCTVDGFFGSTSAPLAQTVQLAATTTVLSSSLNPSALGQTVTFTATVSSPGNNTPNGTVTFMDGNNSLGSWNLSQSGQATFSSSALSIGQHIITAVYTDGGNYAGSTSQPITQTVNQAKASLSLNAGPNPSTYGQPVTFTVGVSSGVPGVIPTGSVMFYDGSTQLGAGAVGLSGGQAVLAISTLSGGSHAITAQYSGDSNYLGGAPPPWTQHVNQAQTVITVVSSANPAVYRQPIAFTATVTGSGAVPTGSVQFSGPGFTSQQIQLDSSGHATFVLSNSGNNPLAPSTTPYAISASYSGDASNAASVASIAQTVNMAQTSTTLKPSVNPSIFGQPVTFTANVSGVSPSISTPSGGTVAFMDGATQIGSAQVTNGQAALTVTTGLWNVPHSITAVYTDGANFYGSASAPVNQVVNPASTTTALTSSVNPSVFGQPVTFTATVTQGPPSNAIPGGVVTFKDGNTILGSQQLVAGGSGVGSLMIPGLSAGSHTITAVFTDPANNFLTSASAPVSINVQKATPVIAWSTPAAITYGAALGSAQLNATASVPGAFTYTAGAGTILGAGSQSLSATFTPTDSTDYNSASATVSIVVLKATPAISWSTPAAIIFGIPLSATQLNARASTAGSFTYSPGAGTILGAGVQTLSATFTPSDLTDYNSASATVSIVVLKATPLIAWSQPANIPYGTALSSAQLDATASVSGTFVYTPPAGTVLNPGAGQTLSVIFTPADSVDYNAVTAAVSINALSGCVFVLAPSSTSVTMSGNPSVQSSCGIYVDSTSSSALLLSGSPAITVTGGGTTNIVGWYTASGKPVLSPAPQKLLTPMPDPFAGLKEPTPDSNCQDSGGAVSLSGSTAKTLNPGTYCHAISMSGSASLTLNPGLYILKGGIAMSGTASITGNQVTLFAYSGSVSMSGTGGINITAPSSGSSSAYAGIAIFQSRSDSSAATLSGGAAQKITGAVYLPDAALTYSGGSSTSAGSITALVVKGITISGNSHI